MTAPAGIRFVLRDRRAIFLMSLVAFVTGLAASALSHTEPFAREAMGLEEGDMFIVFTVVRLASLIGVGFAIYADRHGRRLPFLLALALLPIGNLVTALVPGVVPFTISQALTRIGVVTVAALTVVILAEELSPQIRAMGLGIYAIAGAMGAGVGLILLPIAEGGEDRWRVLFALGGVGLLVWPLIFRFLGESRAYVQYQTKVTFRQALQAGLGRHFWPLAGIAFFVALFSSPAFDFVLERLIDDLGWGARPASFLLVVFSGLGTFGLLVGGRLADSIGRRVTTVTAIVLGLLGGIGFYLFTSGWLLAPAVFVATLGATMLTPSFAAHRSELFPTRVRATAAGWVTNTAIVGSVAGFLVGAIFVDSIGLTRTILLLSSGLLVAMFLVVKLPETKGMDLVRTKAARAGTRTPTS